MAYISFQPKDHFKTVQWTGNGSTNSITGVGFQPDWVWGKSHTSGYSHQLYDVLRGATYSLKTNGGTAQENLSTGLTSFDSDGFTLGSNTNINASGHTVTGWNWKAGGSGSANTDGTINSTVSVNTAAGFSIVTYTGNGSAGSTVGHGLGTTPKLIIVKSYSDNYDWVVYYGDATDYLVLNDAAGTTDSNEVWNDTAPTSTVFTVGNRNSSNQNTATFVAYCFAEKKGFSKFSSYTGNGSTDGTFIHTGFKPGFIITKKLSGSDFWMLQDSVRSPINVANRYITPNSTAGATETNDVALDMLSNGFKLRNTGAHYNGSGGSYLSIAFAEEPFVSSNNIPATAR